MRKEIYLGIILLVVIIILIGYMKDTKKEVKMGDIMGDKITLAGGCFWCMEAFFQEQKGVLEAVSGYSGGSEEEATYLKVSKGNTKHREVIQITYDPKLLSPEEIINFYWTQIDPTDEGGQFADRGYQYTTAIYYHNEEQRRVAEESKKRLEESDVFDKDIATEIVPFESFYVAEDYHQDYYKKASEHYERYKKASGREDFINDEWAKDAAIQFLEQEKKDEYSYTPAEIEELKKNLDPASYHVVGEDGTELPFDNEYWDNKDDGIYVDKVTGEPLFSSTHKYDSGTGWPSFYKGISPESLIMKEDNKLSQTRTEVRSQSGHLGHVFDDGPEDKGGQRFCLNSAALLFVPKEEMEEKGYGEYLYLFE